MRAPFLVLIAVVALALPPRAGQAFDAADAARCEKVREQDNATLAETLRHAGAAPTRSRECYVRVAMLRLGELAEDEFGTVPSELVRRMAGREFRVGDGDPFPALVLERYADRLDEAEPAAKTDSGRRRALEFKPMDGDAMWDVSELRAAPGRDDPPPRQGAPTPDDGAPVASLAGPLAAPVDVPPATGALPRDDWRADPALGELPVAVHLPRNVPPPHPIAAQERPGGRLAPASETGPCLGIDAAGDSDLARNRRVIENTGLCITRDVVTEGAIRFVFTAVHNPRALDGPVWYLPHDNEQEAFDAAIHAVAEYGGRMVAVNGDETRFYRAVDPNRYFAMTAADAAPCRIRRPTPAYTAYVMGLFDGRREILSIHNNTRGGGVSVNVWNAKTRGYPVKSGPFADPDHLVYIASARPPDSDPRAREEQVLLLSNGLNVVHETVTRRNSDCSFSNHVVLNDGRPYFNIEAVHGSRIQRQMVDVLMKALGYRPVAGG